MDRIVVRVYTDYKSPYAYVAKDPTYQLAEKYGVELEWLPYTLRIAEYLGSVEDRSAHYWRKVKYAYMDARRYANQQGLILKGPQRIYNGYFSNAGMLYAKRNGFFRAYNDIVFEKFWKHELDVDSLEQVTEVICSLGGDAAEFAAYANGPCKAEHDGIIDEAERTGVFGVPMFVLDGELFWGGDRIALLSERIEQKLQARPIAAGGER
jgi:2-hydroxychromene-2-carboxylate isomerase